MNREEALEERLSSAIGTIDHIILLVTKYGIKFDNAQVKEFVSDVLRTAFQSMDCPRSPGETDTEPPPWIRDLWLKYGSGDVKSKAEDLMQLCKVEVTEISADDSGEVTVTTSERDTASELKKPQEDLLPVDITKDFVGEESEEKPWWKFW
jgi:hypothetical protein